MMARSASSSERKRMMSSTRLMNSGRKKSERVAGEVARHDEDDVGEVDGAALTVGEASVVEHLEQEVVDVGVGLFDLVEEDDRVGPAADRLGQLAALFVADVAGRRADEPAAPRTSPCTRSCRCAPSRARRQRGYSASARASSVLPTPVGPRKRNEPIGRWGSESPARERRIALETAVTASSWPTTRVCKQLFHPHQLVELRPPSASRPARLSSG